MVATLQSCPPMHHIHTPLWKSSSMLNLCMECNKSVVMKVLGLSLKDWKLLPLSPWRPLVAMSAAPYIVGGNISREQEEEEKLRVPGKRQREENLANPSALA